MAKNNTRTFPIRLVTTPAHLKYCMRHALGALEESDLHICETE